MDKKMGIEIASRSYDIQIHIHIVTYVYIYIYYEHLFTCHFN